MPEKVLVADDDPDVLLLYRVNLQFEGYEVIEAIDGEEAIRTALKEKPALILLDVMMPLLDGWRVLKTLKEDVATRHIPVIMVTAKASEMDQMKGLSYGAVDFVTKPFDPSALLRTMKQFLTSPH